MYIDKNVEQEVIETVSYDINLTPDQLEALGAVLEQYLRLIDRLGIEPKVELDFVRDLSAFISLEV